MRDVLHGILDRVGKIVHRIDAPLVARGVVRHVVDAVDGRVAHVEVAGGKVDLRAQRHGAVRELTGLHAAEEVERLLDGTVAVRAAGRGRQVAAVFAHLLGRQLADIGKTLADEILCALVHLVKILGCIVKTVVPGKAEPADILFDGFDVFRVFFCGVRIVHAQVADAAEFFGGAEIDAQRLAVTDVQIAVRLRREARVHLHALILAAGADILFDKGLDKILDLRAIELVCHVSHPLR